jgi:hypothetical protein
MKVSAHFYEGAKQPNRAGLANLNSLMSGFFGGEHDGRGSGVKMACLFQTRGYRYLAWCALDLHICFPKMAVR